MTSRADRRYDHEPQRSRPRGTLAPRGKTPAPFPR